METVALPREGETVERVVDHSPVVESKWSSKLVHVFMGRRGTTSPLSS